MVFEVGIGCCELLKCVQRRLQERGLANDQIKSMI